MGPQSRIDKLFNKIRAQEQILKEARQSNNQLGIYRAKNKILEYKAEIRRIQETEF